MDQMPMPDWGVHFIVLGVLAAIGVVATLIAYLAPSRGGPIELAPIATFVVWIALVIYATASTFTFGLFGHSWGVLPSYLAAFPVVAVGVLLYLGYRRLSSRRRHQQQKAELISRFELLSWFPENPEPGRLRLHAEVRASIDLDIRFDARAASGSVPKEPEPVPVAAGRTARLSVVLEFPPDRPPVDLVLEFTTLVKDRPYGVTMYEKVDRDVSDGDWYLRRPLPPERP